MLLIRTKQGSCKKETRFLKVFVETIFVFGEDYK